jgi:hypothetical protein
MKKSLLLLLVALSPFTAKAQENVKEDNEDYGASVFFGVTGGIDYNIHAFRESAYDQYPFNFYEIQPHYNFGINLGVLFAKRFRPTLELKFVKNSYGMNWNNYNSTFDKSITKLRYFNANLRFDYLLISKNKLDIFLSPTFKSETLLSSKDVLHKMDGDTDNTRYSFVGKEYPRNVLGVAISSIFKYKINNEMGVTLSPEYTYWGRKFVLDNSTAYQTFSVNLGFEVKF